MLSHRLRRGPVFTFALVCIFAAGVNAQSSDFRTAIVNDDVAAVERLLQERPGFATDLAGVAGMSVLHIAAEHNAQRVGPVLLKAGADFYARDGMGQLALDLPPGQAINETRTWLRAVNRSRNEFLKAIQEQKIDRVKELLAADPSLAGARDIGDGWSAVMMACHFGNADILRVLLAAGASVKTADFYTGQDAVYVCAEKGQVECLRVLIESKADVNQTWRVGYGALPMEMNALHVASWKGHAGIVDLLLAAKVDPNIRAKAYLVFSPLHFAASEGHAEVITKLLAAGADRTAKDGRRGITALEMATAGKHQAAIKVLSGK